MQIRRGIHSAARALGLAACLFAAGVNAATALSVGDASVIEGAAGTVTLDFTVTRTGDLTNALSVNLLTVDGSATAGSDYTAIASGTSVVFPADQASNTVSVTVSGDTVAEANETLILRILSAYEIEPPDCFPPAAFTTGSSPSSLAIGDLDGDGKPDLAVANQGSDSVSVFRNTSTSGVIDAGSFATKQDFTVGGLPFSVAIGDLNGDGKPELVVANFLSSTVSVFRNTSTSGVIDGDSFAVRQDFPNIRPTAVAIGDVDGDTKPDLVTARGGDFPGISVLRNTTTMGAIDANSFANGQDFTAGSNPVFIAIGDLDGDTQPELAVANGDAATVSVFRNTASSGVIDAGSFAAKHDFVVNNNAASVAIGDLDGDGKPDLAVAISANVVTVFRNTSTLGAIDNDSFAPRQNFTTGSAAIGVAIGDLDGDGKPDLVVANVSTSSVSLLRNTASSGVIDAGSFAAKKDCATGNTPLPIAISDIDGDGKPDLVTANIGDNTVTVLKSRAKLATLTPSNGPGADGLGTILDDDSVTGCTGVLPCIRGGAMGPWLLWLLAVAGLHRRSAARRGGGRVALPLLALMFLPALSQAGDGYYGAVMGSVVSRDSDLPVDTGYGGHLLLGSALNPSLNWEVNLYGNRNAVSGAGGGVPSFGFGVDLMHPFGDNRVQPFVLAGVGAQRDDFSTGGGSSNENSPLLNLGAGVLMPVAAGLKLRAELRSYVIYFDAFPASNTAFDFRFNLGLMFGGDGGPAAAPRQELPAGTLDSDRDGVADSRDKCPGTVAGQAVADDGCVDLSTFQLKGVSFATNSGVLQPNAQAVLNNVVSALKAQPGVALEIGGHTDGNGSAERNQVLSQLRADSVRDYLIGHGVAAERLTAKGYGPSVPVESNATAAGRANNRRVEFKVR